MFPPGIELDDLISTRFMGYRKELRKHPKMPLSYVTEKLPPEDCPATQITSEVWVDEEGFAWPQPRPFSQDMNYAVMVMEKCFGSNWNLLRRSDTYFAIGHSPLSLAESRVSMPHAICLAALELDIINSSLRTLQKK